MAHTHIQTARPPSIATATRTHIGDSDPCVGGAVCGDGAGEQGAGRICIGVGVRNVMCVGVAPVRHVVCMGTWAIRGGRSVGVAGPWGASGDTTARNTNWLTFCACPCLCVSVCVWLCACVMAMVMSMNAVWRSDIRACGVLGDGLVTAMMMVSVFCVGACRTGKVSVGVGGCCVLEMQSVNVRV